MTISHIDAQILQTGYLALINYPCYSQCLFPLKLAWGTIVLSLKHG
jgi:hypothetical protein